MARTESNMLALGTKAPNFNLPDTVSGKKLKLSDVYGEKATVVMFICNHCPFVKHLNKEIAKLAKDYAGKDVGFVAISSNDAENYPEDAPDKMKINAEENSFTFPYLYDETQEVAKAYDAACTPDFYVFDRNLELVYRGQFDDSRPGNSTPITGRDIRTAIDAASMGKNIYKTQKPSIGCNIKWKES
ncbi:thioredoxin family protein [Galbibacter sp. EGI 63066]|uniref:thioredoxin family protein n=1 Tax=Galbibacter sp. EGI 63066 TaxID=2993559 RepID=UPI002248EE32|nr:thioredoxin family protein [Galbibacter sp. EGI 63066]MCX2679595.1 thioredoxin family protein [Galbibacter sp. EGI 63066]